MEVIAHWNWHTGSSQAAAPMKSSSHSGRRCDARSQQCLAGRPLPFLFCPNLTVPSRISRTATPCRLQ